MALVGFREVSGSLKLKKRKRRRREERSTVCGGLGEQSDELL